MSPSTRQRALRQLLRQIDDTYWRIYRVRDQLEQQLPWHQRLRRRLIRWFDHVDHFLLRHRYYRLCCWLGQHPWWDL